FGSAAGFGWGLGDTIAAQFVYVPAADVEANARRSLILVMTVFILTFAVVVVLINVLLRRLVVWPLHRMSNLAAEVSEAQFDSEATASAIDTLNVVAQRSDEVGQSARALQKMAREVYEREQLLKQQVQQLRIEIDQAKKER